MIASAFAVEMDVVVWDCLPIFIVFRIPKKFSISEYFAVTYVRCQALRLRIACLCFAYRNTLRL